MSRTVLKSVFSGAVYHKRIAMGLTQEEVAEAISTSVRWYQRIEKGQVLPSFLVGLRLIVLLNLDVNQLLKVVKVYVPFHTH